MNPSDIFKSSLFGQSSPMMAPSTSSSSLFGGPSGAFSPKQTYASTLQSSVTPPPIPSGPQSKLPVGSSGGNSAATTPVTPKSSYVNSQTGSTGTTAPSTAPVTTPSNVNANAAYQGNTISAPIDQNSPQYQYQKAFDSYLQSLQPSDAETSAEKALSAQQLQSQKDNETALDKPGQTLGFASGEAARVAKNNAFQTDALSNTLNSLTSARTARTNATKARLDFEQGLYNDANTAAKPDYTSVSAGSTVFDNKTGKAIYTAPTTASQNGGSGGSSGLVSAIMANPGLFTSLTPTLKSQLIPQLAEAGFDTTKLNVLGLPASQQEDLTTFGSVQDFSNQLLAIAQSNNGSLPGVGGFGKGTAEQLLYGNLGDVPLSGGASGQQTRDLIGQIKGAIAKLRGGTSFTPNEEQLLNTYTPGVNDSPDAIISKLNDLNTFINNKRTNLLGLQAGTAPTGTNVTQPNTQPPAFQLPDGTTVHLQADGTYQ